jgi:hypothetical protein
LTGQEKVRATAEKTKFITDYSNMMSEIKYIIISTISATSRTQWPKFR